MRLIPGATADLREDAVQLASYLVDVRGLTLDDLRRAIALQREQELRFSEAAIYLGFATAADVTAARSHWSAVQPATLGVVSPELQVYRNPMMPLAQKVGALRAQLMVRLPPQQGLRLAVVSASPGDGRSRLAASLAIACAQLEQPTLLIDADLRNPVQHRLFGLDGGQGLVQALGGSSVPQPAGIEGLAHLSVLPAGGLAGDALELISSRPFRSLIESFGSRYRHIIIDTPAAEAGFDGTQAALACGAALLVTRRDHTAMDSCQRLIAQLRAIPVPLLGSVLRL